MRYGTWAVAMAAVVLVGCDEDPVQPEGVVTFTIEVSGETFLARVSDQQVIDDLDARLASATEGVVIGSLGLGNGGFNTPWGWHWEPGTVEVADVAIELCDGRPSMVEDDLTYWIESVGAFCPWGATVVARSPEEGE